MNYEQRSAEDFGQRQAREDAFEKVPLVEFVAKPLDEFLTQELPVREYIFDPWLQTQGLANVNAFRGVGKTYFALNVGYAVACGGSYLSWKAPRARSVLYINGEMPAAAMQERLANIVKHSTLTPSAPFRILTPDLQPNGVPNIANVLHQGRLEPLLAGVELIIVDNVSTLVRTSRSENDDQSWTEMQAWTLQQRAQGRSVIVIHHAGKGGSQRGTSKREDVVDTVIDLKKPADYDPSEGAKFEVHFMKNRGFYGDDAKPFLAHLQLDGEWQHIDIEASTLEKVVELMKIDDMTQRDVAHELGVNKSTVSRHVQKAKEQGLLP